MNYARIITSKSLFVKGLALFLLMLCPTESYSQLDTTSYHLLDSVEVKAQKYSGSIKSHDGQFVWDMKMMDILPKILGNADPLHYSQLLPGVQTNSEYDSGLHIQGCDNRHNHVLIGSAPVYNPSHLLGFFSVFNPTHYQNMELSRTPVSSSSTDWLGGTLSMKSQEQIDTCVSGSVDVSVISSQGTIKLPLGKKLEAIISMRASYLNLLYSHWLKMNEDELRYSFYDANATLLYQPTSNDKLIFNYYSGNDVAKVTSSEYRSDFALKWGNSVSSIDWTHDFGVSKLTQTVYVSAYRNRCNLLLEDTRMRLPSSLLNYGYKANYIFRRLRAGAEVLLYRIKPQSPHLFGTYNTSDMTVRPQNVQTYSLFADYRVLNKFDFYVDAGARALLYVDSSKKVWSHVNPTVSVGYDNQNAGSFKLSYINKTQVLNQTGLSSLGLPIEFWFACDNQFNPQQSHQFVLSYEKTFLNNRWSIYTEIYYKTLTNQVESVDDVFDILTTSYDYRQGLIVGKGYNYGVNIMLSKRTGKITGWLSYTYGRAKRKFTHPDYPGVYPASHERPHELNAVIAYHISKKLQLGATYVFASGTPFTAPKYFYYVNNRILMEYGKHNANRLNEMMRLDLSLNYTFKKKNNTEQGINFSLYNATMHRNDIGFTLIYKHHTDQFSYRPLGFDLRILPSLSYYIKF